MSVAFVHPEVKSNVNKWRRGRLVERGQVGEAGPWGKERSLRWWIRNIENRALRLLLSQVFVQRPGVPGAQAVPPPVRLQWDRNQGTLQMCLGTVDMSFRCSPKSFPSTKASLSILPRPHISDSS